MGGFQRRVTVVRVPDDVATGAASVGDPRVRKRRGQSARDGQIVGVETDRKSDLLTRLARVSYVYLGSGADRPSDLGGIDNVATRCIDKNAVLARAVGHCQYQLPAQDKHLVQGEPGKRG